MTIGVDCDEVLVPTISYHCQFLNEKYKINLHPETFSDYDFWHHYNATRDQAVKDFIEFSHSDLFKSMKPFPDALPALQVLRKYEELQVVSSRQNELTVATADFAAINFPAIFSKVHLGNSFSISGTTRSKLEICLENDIGLIVEDDPKHIISLSKVIPVIMFDKPWNKHVQETPNIIRAYTWPDITDKTLRRLGYA